MGSIASHGAFQSPLRSICLYCIMFIVTFFTSGGDMGTPNEDVERIRRTFHPDDPQRHAILSAMGRKGAQVSAGIRREKALWRELYQARNLADARAHEEDLLRDIPHDDR